MSHACNPSTGKWRQEDPLDSLVSQPSPIDELPKRVDRFPHVCVPMYVCTWTHRCIQTCTPLYTCAHVYICTWTHRCIQTCTPPYTYTPTTTHVHTHACTHMCVYTHSMHTHMHTPSTHSWLPTAFNASGISLQRVMTWSPLSLLGWHWLAVTGKYPPPVLNQLWNQHCSPGMLESPPGGTCVENVCG